MADIAINRKAQFESVQGLLAQAEQRIAAVLPSHLKPETMIRVALTTIQTNERILLCSPLSIIGTVVAASEVGLQLNGFLGEAYMVPYYNSKSNWKTKLECQFQAGYRGLISLARRSTLVSVIKPVLVYKTDHFEIEEGTDQRIIHRPNYDDPTRGETDDNNDLVGLRGAYAIVKFADGSTDFEYLPLARLHQLRDMSKARDREGNEVGPWTVHPAEMYRKVPIRQLAKRLPLSPEFQKAAVMDEYGESGIRQNLGGLIEGDTESFSGVLADVAAARVDDLASRYAANRQPQQQQGQQQPADYGYSESPARPTRPLRRHAQGGFSQGRAVQQSR